jgi:hypothetical protein
MSAFWWGLGCLLVLAGAILRTDIMGVCEKEIRSRLDGWPAGLIRIGIKRIPQEWREDFGNEWLAELEGIRREAGEFPGLIREVLFAFGLLIHGPAIVREFTGDGSRLAAAWAHIRDLLFRPGSATGEPATSRWRLGIRSASPGVSPGGAISLGQPIALITIGTLAIATAVYALQPTPPAKGTHPDHAATRPDTRALSSALDWIVQQVSPSTIVSCDPQACADLVSAGFPAAYVLPLGPGPMDPLGSELVVATAPIRAKYGSRLASVYAPAVIASFGSGTGRIDIRLVSPGGAAWESKVQYSAPLARKDADAQLLANSQITASPTAKAQLLSGDVDPRLPILLASMAERHPVHILSFGNRSPGGGWASPLRAADLATVDSASQLTPAAYLGWMKSFLAAQQARYLPASVEQVTPQAGQAVLQIGYDAPSPFG